MKNFSMGRFGRLFRNAAVRESFVACNAPESAVASHAVILEGRSPGAVVANKRNTTDAGLKLSSMTSCDERRFGFTLIELLVVVLIIGILSAIALPQYRVAVGKAQMMKMAPIVRSIYDAAKRCEMANGTDGDCVNFENLDVHIPGATYKPYQDGFQAHFSSEYCGLRPGPYVTCGRTIGRYDKGESAVYVIRQDGSAYCLASNWGAYDESKGIGHKICKSLGGIKTGSGWNDSSQASTYAFYKLP